MAIDKAKIEEHIRGIIIALGEDPEREGLKDTPKRVANMYEEVLEGINYSNHEIAQMFDTTFSKDLDLGNKANDLVVVKDINAFSYCEHHLALMYNMKIAVGYIPKDKVIGLSKIARIADMAAKRLQLQERIGTDIAAIMEEITGSPDIAVRIEASHSCMSARGINEPNSKTVTTTWRGVFETDANEQIKFLMEAKGE